MSALLETRDLSVRFGGGGGLLRKKRSVQAVHGVSLSLHPGETLALVGESGSGKTTIARAMLGLAPVSDGQILYQGQDTATMTRAARLAMRREVQVVFQDPFGSLDPRLPVGDIIAEPLRIHGIGGRGEQRARVAALLAQVGLPADAASRYPHQFSGGQRQRIGIARALAVQPEMLVCDEAVAALDVSIQAQIINLFLDLRSDLNLTCLFISHDLGVVEHVSDRVAIMYLGRIVEEAPSETVFSRPNHPYTRALLAEVPRLENRRSSFGATQGELPSPLNPPTGCHFHPRCPHTMPRCRIEAPPIREVAPGHRSACHLNDMI